MTTLRKKALSRQKTFVRSCGRCHRKNKIPVKSTSQTIECSFCKKIMLKKALCHCGVVSYVSREGQCCYRCRCVNCVKCDIKFARKLTNHTGMCQKCNILSRTRKCSDCGNKFVKEYQNDGDKCDVCKSKRKCEICYKDFVDIQYNTKCNDCLIKIQCFMNPQDELCYSKVQFFIRYDAYSYKECKCVERDYCSCDRVLCAPVNKELICRIPKFFENKDVRYDNTVHPDHILVTYLKHANLFEGNYQENLKICVQERKNKIVLE